MKTFHFSLTLACLLHVLLSTSTSAQSTEAAMYDHTQELIHEALPVELKQIKIIHIRDRPLIRGMINGKKAYFLLDTGASISMLHTKRAEYYDFTVRPHSNVGDQALIQNFEGVRTATQDIDNMRLELGNLRVRMPIRGFDMGPVVQNVKARTGVRITGIIGADIMRQYRFLIDFQNRKIAYQD